ncbi:hypothetical protein Tco_0180100 [Tanacetum coccineum]
MGYTLCTLNKVASSSHVTVELDAWIIDVHWWVALGLQRQQARATYGAAEADPKGLQEDIPAGQNGVQDDPAPNRHCKYLRQLLPLLGLFYRGCRD